MAATVESALVLIDRASGPIRGIRRELRELQADAERTGKSLDALSGPRQARQMDQLARETRTLGTETHTAGDEIDRAETNMRKLEGRTDSLTGKTKKLHIEWSAFGKTIGLLKIPALVAGVGAATQVVGGLTAGVVALLPKLLDLGGLAAAGGTLMVGMGAGLGVAKLASLGLSKALQGNKAALKGLTPEGRAFVQVLKSMKPELDRLQATAQRGLLPGVTNLLGSLKSQAPQLRGIVGQQSKDLGGLATFLSKQVSNPQFMRDLASLSDQSARALGAGARSGFYFAQAIEQVLLAAAPFTDWLGSSIERFAKMADSEAQAAKESGRLGDFFGRAENAVKRLWDTGEHAFGALRGIMRAARGDSDSLWMSIDKGTKHWDWWANSVTGQTTMQRWFAQMRPVLSATLTLVGDIGKAIGSLTQGPEAAQMLHALDQAMPSIAGGLKSLTENLGPAVVSAFGSFVHLLSDAAGQSGPLTLLARAVGAVASDVDHLMNALGPVGHALGTAFLSFSLLKRLKAFDALDTLRAKWIGVGTAAADATVLERAAALAGETSGGVVPFAGGSGAGAGAAGGLVAPPIVAGESAPGIAAAEDVAAEGGGAGAIAGALGGGAATDAGLGILGRVVLPLAGLQGVLGALGTPGSFTTKVQAGLSAATFGLVPVPVSKAQRGFAGRQYAGKVISGLGSASSIPAQVHTIGRLRQTIRRLAGNDAFDQNTASLRTATGVLQVELRHRERVLEAALKAQHQRLAAQSIREAQALSGDFAKAFEIRAKHDGPESAMEKSVQAVLKKMRGMSPAGAKVLDENVLAWAKQQAKSNPHLLTQVGKLESGIKDSFSRTGQHVQIVNGTILTGSTKEWSAIKAALTTQTEQAREQVSSDFTAIQRSAVSELQAMGFTTPEARSLVAEIEKSGSVPSAPKSPRAAGASIGGTRPGLGKITGTGTGTTDTASSQATALTLFSTGGRLPDHGLEDTVHEIDRVAGMNGLVDRAAMNQTQPARPRRRAWRYPRPTRPSVTPLVGLSRRWPDAGRPPLAHRDTAPWSVGMARPATSRAREMRVADLHLIATPPWLMAATPAFDVDPWRAPADWAAVAPRVDGPTFARFMPPSEPAIPATARTEPEDSAMLWEAIAPAPTIARPGVDRGSIMRRAGMVPSPPSGSSAGQPASSRGGGALDETWLRELVVRRLGEFGRELGEELSEDGETVEVHIDRGALVA